MKKILYNSAYVPVELIAACGLEPVRIIPGGRDGRGARQGRCPYAQALLETMQATAGDTGVMLVTTCDQTRRLSEVLEEQPAHPVFVLNLPSTCTGTGKLDYFMAELERGALWLEQRGGRRLEEETLRQIILDFAAARQAGPNSGESSGTGIRSALIGSELLVEDRSLHRLIEQAGGRVVISGTEDGARMVPGKIDPQKLRENPLRELARIYFELPGIARRPNQGFYRWLAANITPERVRGVVLHHYPWCDLWQAELIRVKSLSPVPVLELEGGREELRQRHATRIGAFLEMLP